MEIDAPLEIVESPLGKYYAKNQEVDSEMVDESTKASMATEECTNTSDSVQRWNTCKFGQNVDLRLSNQVIKNRKSLISGLDDGSEVACSEST